MDNKQANQYEKLQLEKDLHFGIYQATNYLFQDKSAKVYFERNLPNTKDKQVKRTWMILDIIYFAIMAERRISSTIFQEQEMHMTKKRY